LYWKYEFENKENGFFEFNDMGWNLRKADYEEIRLFARETGSPLIEYQIL